MLTVKATQKSKRGKNSKISRTSRTSKTVKLSEDEIGELVLIALGDDELCDAIEEHERRLLALKGGRDPYADMLEAPNGAMIALGIRAAGQQALQERREDRPYRPDLRAAECRARPDGAAGSYFVGLQRDPALSAGRGRKYSGHQPTDPSPNRVC